MYTMYTKSQNLMQSIAYYHSTFHCIQTRVFSANTPALYAHVFLYTLLLCYSQSMFFLYLSTCTLSLQLKSSARTFLKHVYTYVYTQDVAVQTRATLSTLHGIYKLHQRRHFIRLYTNNMRQWRRYRGARTRQFDKRRKPVYN